jgi:hypothetical protein
MSGMSHHGRGSRAGKERESVFAGVIAAFASAVARLRGRRPPTTEVDFTEDTLLWDDDPEGGLAASRVPRRPSDRSGSGSAALTEPTDTSDIDRR